MITAGVLRTLLVIDIAAMALLALIYLRQRKLSWSGYCCWGLLAVGIPILGPFLLIANRPGEWDPSFSVGSDIARLTGWLRRLLPEQLHKKTRLDRVRERRNKRKPRS